MIQPLKNQRVIVALSGGVDSSVSAALLKKKEHEVLGVFFDLGQKNSKEAFKNVKKLVLQLDIGLKIIDLRKSFKKEIIKTFLDSFSKGETPNPCVICNKKIKFENLLKLADKMRFDCFATGHYVKKVEGEKLKVARDSTKDQSYFLYSLNQRVLNKAIFPLGNYRKEEVRKMADKWKLPYFKKESQDICFLSGNHNDYLRKNLKRINVGKIIDSRGKIYGSHRGLPFYTIGQRIDLGGLLVPHYVVEKNLRKNLLIIASLTEEKKYWKKEVKIKNVNWIAGHKPDLKTIYKARIRYRQPLQSCRILNRKSKIVILFNKPQRAVTSGQSLVIYKGQELIGGGIIV